MLAWRHLTLHTRTALVTTALIVGLTATLTWIAIWRERRSFRGELEQQATAVLETLAISSRELLYRLDSEGLAGIARKLTSTESVLGVSFYDERGRLVASSAGVMSTLDVDPVGSGLVSRSRPLRRWSAARLTAGQRIAVAGQTLGGVSVEISTAPMLLKAAAMRNQGIAVALLAAALGIVAAQLFSRAVTRPLDQLTEAARRIGAGDLDQEIPVPPGGGEIAVLSGALEQMRVDLRSLYGALEAEVAARTRELQAANLALSRSNEELAAKAAELEQFAHTISHDLRSPLITISSFLSLVSKAADEGDMERLRQDLERISGATDHMRRLLEELLRLSRIGRVVNPPEPVALAELAREALEHVAGGPAGRQMEVSIDPDLPRAYGDRLRLVEVFENLLHNAVKYSGEATPQIVISSRRRDGELCICVADRGIGIEPALQQKVFDLFTKLDPSTEGSGIGLAIVKRIVEVHGGRIWVESPGLGDGARFCFTLPPPPADASTVDP